MSHRSLTRLHYESRLERVKCRLGQIHVPHLVISRPTIDLPSAFQLRSSPSAVEERGSMKSRIKDLHSTTLHWKAREPRFLGMSGTLAHDWMECDF